VSYLPITMMVRQGPVDGGQQLGHRLRVQPAPAQLAEQHHESGVASTDP
jgi:hypothetical protein